MASLNIRWIARLLCVVVIRGERVSNTVALKADKENKQYKLFANGELIATLDQEAFKFISDITGVDNVMLGGTMRQGTVAIHLEVHRENAGISGCTF